MHLDGLKSKSFKYVPQLETPQNIVFPDDNGPVAGIDNML